MFAWKSDRRERLYKPWRICLALLFSALGGALTGFCSLRFAMGDYPEEMFASYLQNPYILALNLLPPILLAIVFYLLFNRAWLSFLATNAAVILPSLISFYKMSIRGDPLIAEDLSLVTESKKMLETYDLFMTETIRNYLWVLCGVTLLFLLLLRGRFRRFLPRTLAAVLLLVTSIAVLTPTYASGKIYDQKTENSALINPWSETEVYVSKGFVYPFLHSIRSALHPAPAGYSKAEAEELLSAYTDEGIPAEKAVNLVCVMLEAFNDFSRFEELTFTEDIYAKYHELEAMGYSGTLVTDIFAGDTRVSEREFLTGMPYERLDNFVAKSNSYVWYLRENGYTVEGAHPCFAWFYNRQVINKNLGFENYYFSENYFAERTQSDITYDGRFFPMLKDIYEARDTSKPYFSFSVSYQGHGPYEADNAYFPAPYIENKGYPDADMTIVNNYLNSVSGTVEYLYEFATAMLEKEEPIVLVFFGDHKPWLGNNGSVYETLGIDLDLSTEDGFANRYTTRYLILANDAAKKLCENDFMGEGETLSVSFLMNKVFSLCGYTGSAYMQCTSEIAARTPVIHRSDDKSEGDAALYDRISYYYRKNFLYE